MRICDKVRGLFRAPFRCSYGMVRDASGNTTSTPGVGVDEYIARGWGRIQYIQGGPDAFDLWVGEFRAIVGAEETDGDVVAAKLNAAWELNP